MDATELVEMTELELYAELGRELTPSASFGPGDMKVLARLGRTWMEKNQKELAKRICGTVKETGDTLTDASAIAVALGSLHALDAVQAIQDVSIYMLVALIVVKQGIAKYCNAGEK